MEAQRRLTKSQEPLLALDTEVAALQQQLAQAQQALTAANERHSAATQSYIADDSPAHSKALIESGQNLKLAEVKVQGLTAKLEAKQAQRLPHQRAVDEAGAVLRSVTVAVRIEVLEDEINVAKYRIAEHDTAMREWERRWSAMKKEKLELETSLREEQWREDKAKAKERFLQVNPDRRNERVVTRQGL